MIRRLLLCWRILRGQPVAYRIHVHGTLLMPPGSVTAVESSVYPRVSDATRARWQRGAEATRRDMATWPDDD